MAWIEGVTGVLLDVDGTLLVGERAVPGAAEFLDRLDRRGVEFRVTTNTTRRPISSIGRVLRSAGLPVEDERVLTPAILARRRILQSGRTRAAFLLRDECLEDFAGVERVECRPDWVVVGDLGSGFDYRSLNRAFRWLRSGAGFLALQKNRYWMPDGEQVQLDAGPFVAALEFALEIEAELMGKPSRGFFEQALGLLGRPAAEVLVVGDDVQTDGRGGAAAGCRTAAVRTGKFREEALRSESYTPDLILDSVAGLAP